MRLRVVLTKDRTDGFYVARCPALPGCVSQGASRQEALVNIREAIEGVLITLNERAHSSAAEEVVDVEV